MLPAPGARAALVLRRHGAQGARAQSLPTATPESQGFSVERLERLHKRMHEFVNDGKHAGIVVLIARNGKVVETRAYGMRDREQKLRMEEDTIFRIYSMSKVITSVAAMILHEEGRLKLDDPISKLPAGLRQTEGDDRRHGQGARCSSRRRRRSR